MKSLHFKIHELVPKAMFEKYGERAWRFVDVNLIKSIDAIKGSFPDGSMTINNYSWGGDREWSGIRTPDSPWFSQYSQHTFGKAIDAVFSKYPVDEVRQFIIDNPEKFPHIRGIELDVSWLHIDCRNEDRLVTFSK